MATNPTADVLAALRSAASETGVPLSLLWGVAFAESGFNPAAIGPVTASGERAQGLMQLMPKVAAANGVTDPMDATQSALGGARVLAKLGKALQWDVSKMLAAYVWGPTNYARAVNAGQSVPANVATYVRRALAAREVYRNKADKPEGSYAAALGASIEALAALNPNYAPAAVLLGKWHALAAKIDVSSDASSLANLPTLRAVLRDYAAVYERAPITDESTPRPGMLEPEYWEGAQRVYEGIKRGAGDAALGLGGGLFAVALFWFYVSSRRR